MNFSFIESRFRIVPEFFLEVSCFSRTTKRGEDFGETIIGCIFTLLGEEGGYDTEKWGELFSDTK